MDTISAAQLARQLGTTTPRVLRGVHRLGLNPSRGPRGALQLTTDDVAQLVAELGVEVRIPGLRRAQVIALAALARSPLGVRSARALARVSGLAPTAASLAIADLVDLSLAERRQATIAEGRARTVEIVCANVAHPRWPELAPRLAGVALCPVRRATPTRVPARLGHVFWNAPLRELDPATHGAYLARRILLHGDTQALAWAAEALGPADWNAAARTRGLDPRRRALARNLAASAP